MGVAYHVEGRADSLGVLIRKNEKKENLINAKIESEPDNLFVANAIGILLIEYRVWIGIQICCLQSLRINNVCSPVIKQGQKLVII